MPYKPTKPYELTLEGVRLECKRDEYLDDLRANAASAEQESTKGKSEQYNSDGESWVVTIKL